MTELEKFRQAVETHIIRTGISPTTFGLRYAGEPLFVFQLRKGREPRTAKRRQVLENMKRKKK
jgi:homoserine dehydrogenase